jgi:multimeric flavodoxin WrbA
MQGIEVINKMSQIIILGSSRSFGNTRKAVNAIIEEGTIPLIDLNTLDIKPYDYEYRNHTDNFIALIERIIEFDTLILATPVYWYTMSATMKIFIDRISDLLDIRKDLGRKLRGKNLFVIASYITSLPKGFEDAFEQTCQYLRINYLGTSYIYGGVDDKTFLAHSTLELLKAQEILRLPTPD